VPEPPKRDEPEEKKTAVITAKSEIELTSPTPKPTLTAKPSVTVTPRPKPSPKPVRRPTPKKTLVAKASPKPSPKALKKRRSADRRGEIASVKRASPSQTRGEKTGSTDKNASAGVGNTMSEFGWYGNMLHDRFYRAWIQPTKNVAIGKKLSALVRLRIDKDGRVSRFDIIKPSGNTAVDESVRVVAKQVTEVDPPPTGLFKGDHYDVKINFELSTEEKVGN
jgi:protein TonB